MGSADDNLRSGLAMVDSLVALENHYLDPPPPSSQLTVAALRGGSIVLLVSTLEEYLKQRTQEAVKYLNSHLHDYEVYDFDKLPGRLIVNHYHLTIKFAADGNKWDGLKPQDRIPAIQRAVIEIPAKRLDAAAFSQTQSNPNSNTLKKLFYDLGQDDVLNALSTVFQSITASPKALTYLADTLDALISLRNKASHAPSTMNISRQDVDLYREFVSNLCHCVNINYDNHCRSILKTAER